MEIIIYGKDGCPNCDKTRMLCQIQSLAHQVLKLDADYSAEALQTKVGQPVRSLPQIFVRRDGEEFWIGDYDALRAYLRSAVAVPQAA